jgi:hypothetical protein
VVNAAKSAVLFVAFIPRFDELLNDDLEPEHTNGRRGAGVDRQARV